MALILPSAPASFYAPSLEGIKTALETVNGSSAGQVALITALPANIEVAWSTVGVGNNQLEDMALGNLGTAVVGAGAIGTITGPVTGNEESPEEVGYKLQIGAVPSIDIYIDGSGTTTATVIGCAWLKGRDDFSLGTDADVLYITKVDDVVVTDGQLTTLPAWELAINYAEASA